MSKLSLKKRREIIALGELGFKEGRSREDNIFGYSHPIYRCLWWEGWDKAKELAEGKA